ncbi:MAG: choice-of-anchor D domain-containing protein, partial [Candidatus Cloacimonetes bacterium]|nr:choice-of-anchor D domain-containing protein [Candidatus Cloacimonadota bacterium]
MKKLLILLFALAFLGIAFADTVTVGTGTATGSTLPISAGWGYTYSQQIYTQAQINKSGDITKIRFYYVSGPIALNKDWVIYMGHTTKTTFATTTDWEPLANLTQVFAGDVSSMVPLANNWMEITLSTPFTYNNSDNLIVAVDENTPSYASMSWGAFTSGTNTGIYYRSDSANPDPATPPTASGRSGTIARIQFAFPNTAAPLAPTLVTPANGDWSFTDGKLIWNNNAGGADAASYDVYFGTAATPPLVSSAQTTTSYTPTLAANTTYYWNVVANNEIGSSPASSTWSFKTPTTTQVAESFEPASFPPAGWANPGTWSRSISVAQNGVASAYKYPYDALKYIVSLPKVTLTATSTLNFWTQCSSNNASAVWDVVWSTDRVTWTQVAGSSFTHPTASVWVNRVIDLSSLAGNSYYLGIRAGGYSYASYYFDSVFGPEVTPEAPGPVAQVLPADVATLVSEKPTFTWTAPVTGGIPTGYKIYCDTNTDPTTLITTVSALTYTFTTALNYETLYYWKVVATNGTGDAVGSTVRSFTTRANPTVATFPTVYDFGTLGTDAFPPLNWTKHSGVLASPTVLGAAGTGNWIQDDWKNVTTPANKAAKLNIYSTLNGWLISPPIAVPAADYEVMFDVAYMAYGSNAAPATTGTDDQFMVLIGDGTSWTPANVARQWDNAGSPYVLNNIPPAGMTVSLPFGAAGTYYVAFYAISTVANVDNDFMVDNITFRQTPAAPIFTLTPSVSSWDFGPTMINSAATKVFTITNSGGGTLNLSSVVASGTYYSISVAPTDNALTAGESTNFTVQYLPTSVVGNPHAGSVTINDDRAATPITLSGSCVDPTIYAASLPSTQNFDAVTVIVPALPLGWTKKVTDVSGFGYVQTTTGGNTTPNRAVFYNSSDSASDLILITPLIDSAVNINTLRVRFKAIGGAGYTLEVGTVDAAGQSAVFTLMQAVTITASWAEYTVPFNTYAGTSHYLAFRHGQGGTYRTSYIDDVVVESIPTAPIFGYAPTTIAFGTALATNPAAYQNVTVTNHGAGTLDLTAADISLIGTDPTEFGLTT